MKTFQKIMGFCLLLAFVHVNAQTQAGMNQQAQEKYLKSDKELNKVYKQLLGSLNAKNKTLLIQSQKDWIRFRDSHCAFETNDYQGGSMRPMVYSTCLQERTDARIKDLKASIKSRASK